MLHHLLELSQIIRPTVLCNYRRVGEDLLTVSDFSPIPLNCFDFLRPQVLFGIDSQPHSIPSVAHELVDKCLPYLLPLLLSEV
jgi:hypothetical protein